MKEHYDDDCKKPHPCGVCDPPYYERNNYFYGKLLTVRDFLAEQRYFNQKRHLINRMILGWGVVCGLDVHKKDGKVVVSKGLAIDCCGREILVCEPWEKTLDYFEKECGGYPEEPPYGHREPPPEKPEEGGYQERSASERETGYQGKKEPSGEKKERNAEEEQGSYGGKEERYAEEEPYGDEKERYGGKREPRKEELVVCLKYSKCKSEKVKLQPVECDEEEALRYNRVRDHYEIEVKKMREVSIPEPLEDCCPPMDHKQDHQKDCLYHTLHDDLCGKLKKGCPRCKGDCLVLAKITLTPSKEGHSEYGRHGRTRYEIDVDPCYRRRLVYNNTLLYQLIDCFHGDLPHIYKVNWDKDAESVTFEEFERMACDEGFTVYFDKKMKSETINKRNFRITVVTEDPETCFLEERLVPLEEPRFKELGECCSVTFRPTDDWITDTFKGSSRLKQRGGEVEIKLRGSCILGQCGKALDGEWIAKQFPTGNGVQGGDFICGFTVRPHRRGYDRPDRERPDYDRPDRERPDYDRPDEAEDQNR